jgi:hypothetical protein
MAVPGVCVRCLLDTQGGRAEQLTLTVAPRPSHRAQAGTAAWRNLKPVEPVCNLVEPPRGVELGTQRMHLTFERSDPGSALSSHLESFVTARRTEA